MDRETLMVVFVGIIAGCVLLLTLGIAAVGIMALRIRKQVTDGLKSAQAKALPIVDRLVAKAEPGVSAVSDVLRDTAPKVKVVTDNLVEISHVARAQVTDLDSTLSDATSKARSQVDRVNSFMTNTFDTTAEVASSLERGIRVPVRGFQGIVNGVKAGVEVLLGQRQPPVQSRVRRAEHRVEDEKRDIHAAAEAARTRSAAESAQYRERVGATGDPATQTVRERVEAPVRSATASQDRFSDEIGRAANSVAEGGRTVVEAGKESARGETGRVTER